jgi:hypothetical protein
MPKKRTLKALSKELINNPFFPLLFISEAVKIGVLDGWTQDFRVSAVLAGVCVVLWVLSDSIDVDVESDTIIGDGGQQK